MRISTSFISLAFALLSISTSTHAYAAQYTCSTIKETQLRYDNQSNPNQGQYASFFGMSDVSAQGVFTINTDNAKNTALLTFTDSNKNKTNQPIPLNLVSQSKQEISFSGLLGQNPILLTLYPQNKLGVYSLHSMDGKSQAQLRVNIRYARCVEEIEQKK